MMFPRRKPARLFVTLQKDTPTRLRTTLEVDKDATIHDIYEVLHTRVRYASYSVMFQSSDGWVNLNTFHRDLPISEIDPSVEGRLFFKYYPQVGANTPGTDNLVMFHVTRPADDVVITVSCVLTHKTDTVQVVDVVKSVLGSYFLDISFRITPEAGQVAAELLVKGQDLAAENILAAALVHTESAKGSAGTDHVFARDEDRMVVARLGQGGEVRSRWHQGSLPAFVHAARTNCHVVLFLEDDKSVP